MAHETGETGSRTGTYGELVEAQHVHDAYLGDDCPEEVRPLVAAGCYQQATVGASLQAKQQSRFAAYCRKSARCCLKWVMTLAELNGAADQLAVMGAISYL